MERIAEFQKVSFEQFAKAMKDTFGESGELERVYEEIILPRRATAGSAGYDFRSTVSVSLAPGETVMIPTGIRVRIDKGWALLLFPRSGLGFRYRLQLNNTVGVIDSDYYDSDNEGHIFIKITNDSNEDRTLSLKAGDCFFIDDLPENIEGAEAAGMGGFCYTPGRTGELRRILELP